MLSPARLADELDTAVHARRDDGWPYGFPPASRLGGSDRTRLLLLFIVIGHPPAALAPPVVGFDSVRVRFKSSTDPA
jgi:hypothetical protein